MRELAAAAITEIATESAVDAEDAAASPVVVHVVAADDLTQTSAAAARPAQVTDCGLLAILPKQPGTTVPTDLCRASACGFCGLAGDTLLLTCSRCKSMCYCSAAHQKQHWYFFFNLRLRGYDQYWPGSLLKNNPQYLCAGQRTSYTVVNWWRS